MPLTGRIWWCYALIVGFTFLVYSNSLQCEFTFDDNSAVVLNRHVHTNETSWFSVFHVDYWGTPIKSEHSHKSYRPVTLFTFRLNFLLFGLDPFGYHLVNVVLHITVSLICFKFLLNILNNDLCPALISTLFFALHPLKTEAVSGIVGRAELLSTFFILISLFCYLDSAFISFAIYVILATFSKEQGLTIPCICIALELTRMLITFHTLRSYPFLLKMMKIWKDGAFIRITLLILYTATLSALRFYLMGGSLPVFTKFDNPASFEDSPTRQLTYNYLLPLNAMLMLYPLSLCADWTMNSIPLVHHIDDPRNGWTVLFYTVLCLLSLRAFNQARSITKLGKNEVYNAHSSLAFALIITVIPFIPASNLFFPVGFVIAERVLYTPSIGYSLLLAIGLKQLLQNIHFKTVRFLLYLCALVMLISLGLRTYYRNFDWHNDLTLFQSGLKVNPNNAKLYNNIGHFYERHHQYSEAIEYFKKAAQIDSEDLGSELNIARALIHMERIAEAEQLLWSIKPRVRDSAIRNRIVPHYLNIWINLARVISMNDSRLIEAENLYLEVISIRHDFIDAYINLGEIYIRKTLYHQAIDIYKRALAHAEYKHDPKVADLHYNIGIAKSLQLENYAKDEVTEKHAVYEEIAQSFVQAIEINSDHKEAIINLAILVQKPDWSQSSQLYYRNQALNALKSYSKNQEHEMFQFNIAITLLDLGGPSNRLEAINYLKRAVELKPDFRSALYNLALLYYDFKDYNSSLLYLNQTTTYHANYTKALLLMADIYARLGKMNLTEKIYTTVLEHESENYEALHNLCLIYHKTQQQSKMERCALKFNTYQTM